MILYTMYVGFKNEINKKINWFGRLTAAMPFDEKEEQVLYKKIVMGNFEMRPQDWETLHPSACDLVKALITVDPVKRLSVQQALAHPWLNDDGEIADIVQHIMESQRNNNTTRLSIFFY